MNKDAFKAGLLISIIILLAVAYSAYTTFRDFDMDAGWVAHSERVKASIESISSLPRESSNEIRKAAIMGSNVDKRLLQQLGDAMTSQKEALDSLIMDNQEQKQNLKELLGLISNYSVHADSIIAFMSDGYSLNNSLRKMILAEEKLLDSILLQADNMKVFENQLLEERTIKRSQSQSLAPLTLLVLTFVALALITFLFIVTFNLVDKNVLAKKNLELKVDELDSEIRQRSSLQNLLRNVLDSSSNGIMAFTSVRDSHRVIQDFRFDLVNKTATKIVAMAEKELVGNNLLDKIPGNLESGLFDAYKEVVETGQEYKTVQFYNYDDMSIWFDIVAVKNADGFVVSFTDVTEQKNYEEELLLKQEELEATNFELEQFAYIASHDLQEPLRKVRTFGDRLRTMLGDKLNERGSDYLARMQNAAERMQTLIDDLLKFSRVSRADRDFKPVDLNVQLDIVLDDLDIQLSKKQGVVTSETLPTLLGDKIQFEQLFQNLISNSIKYSKDDVPPKIEVTVSSVKEKLYGLKTTTDCWKICVSDNGIGFDPQYKEQIFVIFKRLHGRMEYSGSGIGLAICEKIVKNHGGLIYADSQLGEGTTFTIILPKHLDSDE